jgi:hypothetical protein
VVAKLVATIGRFAELEIRDEVAGAGADVTATMDRGLLATGPR